MKKRALKNLIFIILIATIMLIFVACKDNSNSNNIPTTEYFEINYLSSENGSIAGNPKQTIELGNAGTEVTAIPNEGYRFVEWSDGLKTATRKELNVENDSTFTAYFEKQERTYIYEYNRATSDTSIEDVTISYETFGESPLIVPKKEKFIFKGWYLDEDKTIQLTDDLGNLIMGLEIFDKESTNLYAKWIAEEEIIYKVLMVYVTETKARLKDTDGIWRNVNYKMSAIERQVCELIGPEMEKLLNEWFDGLVIFEFEDYFTTKTVTTESFSSGLSSGYFIDYSIFANDIPEVQGMLKDYRTIMTTFGMNDYDYVLHNGGGSAWAKYASCHAETIFDIFLAYKWRPITDLLNLNDPFWDFIMDHYMHEFTHTAECYYRYDEIYEYHATPNGIDVTRLYLLGQLEIEDETVGIPHSYWQGKFNVRASYGVNGIQGKLLIDEEIMPLSSTSCIVLFGGDTEEVTAIPKDGYRFVEWSDGVTTATRRDYNVVENFYVEAIFEEIEE